MQAFLAGCAFLVMSTGSQPAVAEPTGAELSEARALFAEATTLEGNGDYAAAARKLERAVGIKETPGLRYHLGHCEEQLGSLVAAIANYERASELIQAGAVAPDVEPLLPLASRRLDSRVARLEIVVPADLPASGELDGVTLPPSSLGAAVKVDPGSHRLLVRSPGQPDFIADLTLTSGERRTLKVFFAKSPPPVPAPAALAAPAPPPRGSESGGFGGREVVLLGEAALTLTGLGLGVGFLVARGNAADRVEHAQTVVDQQAPGGCAGVPAPAACADLDRALEDHERASTLATASFVGAGVAASALVLTWALWPAPRAVSLTAHASTAGVTVAATGEF